MPTATKVTHTPGPWRLDWWTLTATGEKQLVIEGNNHRLAVLDQSESGRYAIQRDEAEANARLIAAAPELLEALKALADCGTQEHDEDLARTCSEDEPLSCALCAARAAIARAEGH